MKQAIDSLYETQISALTKCFITLSLEDIAKSVNLPSASVAEKYLVRMIDSGKINAVIHQQNGSYHFLMTIKRLSDGKINIGRMRGE